MHPGITLKIELNGQPLLLANSDALYLIARCTGPPQCTPACLPACTVHGWYQAMSFVTADGSDVSISLHPEMLAGPPGEDEPEEPQPCPRCECSCGFK